MSFQFDANGSGGYSGSVPANGAETIFRLKQLLKSVGWVVTQSSDGSTYSGSSDIITSPTSVAGGMFNPLAYFVIAQPAPRTRQFLFQISTDPPTTGQNWRIIYSPAAGFTGYAQPSNTPANATNTPSAADELYICGGPTDNSPSFTPIFYSDGGYRLNIIAGNVASNSCFFLWTNIISAPYIYSCILLDVMQPGTYPVADPDPSVIYLPTALGVNAVFNTDLTDGTTNEAQSNYNSALYPIYALTFGSGFASPVTPPFFPTGGGSNNFTGKDDFTPVPWGITTALATSNSSPSGWKGVSSILFYNSVSRLYGNPYQDITPKDYISLSGDSTQVNNFIAVPWNGTTLTI